MGSTYAVEAVVFQIRVVLFNPSQTVWFEPGEHGEPQTSINVVQVCDMIAWTSGPQVLTIDDTETSMIATRAIA